jgi:branched-chain amino acid aminotransferase
MDKSKKIWMDGALVDWDKAQVHVLTHTLHYGLGVFEGIRCYRCADGRSSVFRLKEHIERLFTSAHIALIDIPYTPDDLCNAVVETLKANSLDEGYIRPLVYLGNGSMGLLPKDNPVKVSIAAWAWGAYLGEEGLARGIRVKVSSFARNNVNSSMTKAKITGSYVNSILAKKEAAGMGFDEALLLDTDGCVSEGSGENIFIVKDGIMKTTELATILPGITRDSVMRIAADKGLTVKEERFTRDELYIADEAFFTGTAAEITPIREVDSRAIGTGKPGPVTLDIQKTYFDAVKGADKSYESWLYYL